MWHDSAIACTSNVRGVWGSLRGSFFASQARNCKQTVIQASSPLTKKQIFKFLIKLFLQILKLSFTRKNWLLKFGFACSLAQILEPKLLVHEILKFVWNLLVKLGYKIYFKEFVTPNLASQNLNLFFLFAFWLVAFKPAFYLVKDTLIGAWLAWFYAKTSLKLV